MRVSAELAALSYWERSSVLALSTSLSLKPYRLILFVSLSREAKDSKALPSLQSTWARTTSQLSQSLPMPNPASRKGASDLAERSLSLSFIMLLTRFFTTLVSIPIAVLFISSGIGSLFQYTLMLVLLFSLSVSTPMTGSSLSGILMTSFWRGFSTAGMSAKVDLIFASTSSTSKSPTTTSACISGRYQVW